MGIVGDIATAAGTAYSIGSSIAAGQGADHAGIGRRTRKLVKAAAHSGLSPLALLGSPISQPAAQTVGGGDTIGQQIANLGPALDDMGANITGQALKERDLQDRMNNLRLTNAQLQNDLLQAQIARQRKEVLYAPPGPTLKVPGTNPFGPKTASDAGSAYGQIVGEGSGILNFMNTILNEEFPKGSPVRTFADWWSGVGTGAPAPRRRAAPIYVGKPGSRYHY
ncbi:DNA pilot protein [Blackfly microvirus SF02]|uniref:DNA pilot protein n=1 Tax=Blackfly microvirus SF02 TaxID=2576452 RepID=A0A4P8PTX1_9VIRU|nr:DNA pilot protein [Blackfly microvirus SF02]